MTAVFAWNQSFIFVVDFCFINSTCLSDGQTQIGKDCLFCQPNSSRTDWTLKKGYQFLLI